MENIILLFGSASILTFIGNIITLFANRNKNKAETTKLLADTEETRVKMQNELQDQIFELITQNNRNYEEREKERDAKRIEINLLGRRIETLSEMVAQNQERELKLMIETAEKDKRIHSLENNIRILQADMTAVKRVTGKLNAR